MAVKEWSNGGQRVVKRGSGGDPALEDDVHVVRHVPPPVYHVPEHQVGPPQPGRDEAHRLEVEALRGPACDEANSGQIVVK